MGEEKLRDLGEVSLYKREDGEVVARDADGRFVSGDSVDGSARSPSGSGRLKSWQRREDS